MRGSMKDGMKLSNRLILGFGAVLLVMVVTLFMALYTLSHISARLNKIIDADNVKIDMCYRLQNALKGTRLLITKGSLESVITTDTLSAKNNEELAAQRAKYNEIFAELTKAPADTEEGRRFLARIVELTKAAVTANNQMMELRRAGNIKEAEAFLINQADPAMAESDSVINSFVEFQKKFNSAEQATAKRAAAVSVIMMLILGIVAVALGAFLAFYISRSITKPVNKIVNALNEGAEQVAAASNQLSASAQQLSQGSTEQAAAIEESSSTLQESASMLQQNSANTIQAAELSEHAKSSSNKGSIEMQEMMGSMQEIKKSSDQIAKIIKVIDDIAFQTNILALNAAIEAARAGEAGMGFAVVAEEVRNLAQRSAQAAKDTTAIIESNIELSNKGVTVAERVKEALTEITTQAKKVSELLEEISAASQEQAQGMDQVNKAMSQMETVTQQNAANAEESASAAEELTAQSESMRKIVLELSQLVNGKASTLETELEFSNYGTHHPTHHPGQPAKTALYQSSLKSEQAHSNHLLPEQKTKVVSPEDVIPLEKDPRHF